MLLNNNSTNAENISKVEMTVINEITLLDYSDSSKMKTIISSVNKSERSFNYFKKIRLTIRIGMHQRGEAYQE